VEHVPALILAGGLGTRLRGLLPDTPKVLAPVLGRPFLAFLLDALDAAGARRVTLCTGYQADKVEQAFGLTYKGLTLRYSREEQPLGTGGALRRAAAAQDGERFLALNGDSFVACDLAAFDAWHNEHGFAAALVLARVDDAARFGTVDADERGAVRGFHEKQGRAEPGWINAGVYLLGRELLLGLPEQGAVSIERDAFPHWLGRGLGGYRVDAPFLDIGTPESLARAEAFLAGLPRDA
jgi:NDP-sugar pyrophosphorylase family protein